MSEEILNQLTKIQSWPSVALVFALVIIAGYCFRFWKSFPNEAIPTVVILLGAVCMMLLSDATPDKISARVWHTRNFIIGLTIGFIAWIVHNVVISRIEDYLSLKFPAVGNLLGGTAPQQNNKDQV